MPQIVHFFVAPFAAFALFNRFAAYRLQASTGYIPISLKRATAFHSCHIYSTAVAVATSLFANVCEGGTIRMARSHVLSHYRELLRLIGRLPQSSERASALKEARKEMRQQSQASEEHVADLLRVLVSKIGYLRMITPKKSSDKGRIGVGKFVVRDGNVVEGSGASAGERVADGSLSQDEAWKMHRKLMKRQYFGQEPPRIPEIF